MNNEYTKENKTTDSDRLIHTPSVFARKNLIYAQETGRLKSLKQHSCVRENLESYLFFVIEDGEGVVNTAGKDYKAVKGDAVLLDCRKRYSHISSSDNPWTIRWIHFNGSCSGRLFELFQEANAKSPVFTPKNGLGEYMDMLEKLNERLCVKNVLAELEQSMLIERVLSECLKDVASDKVLSVDNNEEQLESDEFSTLRESVNEHIGEKHLERILSIQYGLEPGKLSELFEKKYGISLPDYILNRKLNKAKELLRFTIKTLDEIIEESGIVDEKLFRDLFMESEEMTPEEYRKKWAQWIKS